MKKTNRVTIKTINDGWQERVICKYWAVYGGEWREDPIMSVPDVEIAAMTASQRARVIAAQDAARKAK